MNTKVGEGWIQVDDRNMLGELVLGSCSEKLRKVQRDGLLILSSRKHFLFILADCSVSHSRHLWRGSKKSCESSKGEKYLFEHRPREPETCQDRNQQKDGHRRVHIGGGK